MTKTTDAFGEQIQKVCDVLKFLEGKTVEKVFLTEPPKENKGLFQTQPIIVFQIKGKSQGLGLNLERILYHIWNETKQSKI